MPGRRPVVAVLDSGCYPHPWLDGVVSHTVTLDGKAVGYVDPWSDPETWGDLEGPLDGLIDTVSGHGTFIAGLVHQTAPDADIVSWRVVPSEGVLVEKDWIATLAQIEELVSRHVKGDPSGHPVEVLNLSMGYYHETPADIAFDGELGAILDDLSAHGTIIVCSAGNDGVSRPSYPAAFGPWETGERAVDSTRTVPIVSVGATNPNGTDALFSNTGPWVRVYAQGAALMSTMPPFQGGFQPMARTVVADATGKTERTRESIDPDDFTGGFAVWSGTSFSAPVVAGRLARALTGTMPATGAADTAASARQRAWAAIEAVTPLRR